MYPLVGDPLGAHQDGAGGMPGVVDTLTILVQVVPEQRGILANKIQQVFDYWFVLVKPMLVSLFLC